MLHLNSSSHMYHWPQDNETFDFDELPEVMCERKASSGSEFFDFDDLPPVHQADFYHTDVPKLPKHRQPDLKPFSNDSSASPASTAASSAGELAEQSWDALAPTESRIALLCNGSVGDLNPILALARLLKQRHVLCVFTNFDLVPTCLEKGIDAVAIYADMAACMLEMGGIVPRFRETAMKGRDAARIWLEEHPGACTPAEEALSKFLPDVLVCTAGALRTGVLFERDFGVPMVPLILQRLCTEFMEDVFFIKPSRPCFFAVSEHICCRKPEVPEKCIMDMLFAGTWVLEEEPSPAELQQEPYLGLQAFLDAGDAPVAMGWGSMILKDKAAPELLDLALQTLRLVGRRGVIVGGWAQLHELGRELQKGSCEDAEFAREHLFFVPEVRHNWLFPKCRCVVHHGGSGTIMSAMRAGVPSVVTPVLEDQQEVAVAVNQQGVGVGFRQTLDIISVEQLAWAVLQAELCAAKAKELAAVVRKEAGPERGASVLEDFLEKEVHTGKWAREALMASRQTRH